MKVGDRIKAARKAANMTQEQLASQAGISWGYLRQLETNRRLNPTGETLQAVAVVLGISVDSLLGERLPSTAADMATPPVDLLRAAGYSEALIADLSESWLRQPRAFRADVLARAQQHVKTAQEEEDRLRAFLRAQAGVG